MNNSLRWDPYVLLKNKECSNFCKSHFSESHRKVLFILGKGFDYRMNACIRMLKQECPGIAITCLLIEFDEGKSSSSKKYGDLVKQNFEELKDILGQSELIIKTIQVYSVSGRKKRRVGDKNISDLFNEADLLDNHTDIIADISALPRGLFFSLIGKIMSLLDARNQTQVQNFFVVASENAQLDKNITDNEPDDELSYVFGFKGGSELTSAKKPVIWLPILGEDKLHQIRTAYEKCKPEEICPVLPFPSKNPRRSDNLLIEYHKLLFDELGVEAQNMIYVPEQNPFEVYRTIHHTVTNYYNSLNVLGGCDIVISTFSSKLLSIGALLIAYEFKALDTIKVGILNVDSSGHEINSDMCTKNLVDQSELFLTWLSGEAYIK